MGGGGWGLGLRESQALRGQARVLEDGETETIAGGCHKSEAINGPLCHGMPSLIPVTSEEKGKEMAKCLLGLKLSNCIKR